MRDDVLIYEIHDGELWRDPYRDADMPDDAPEGLRPGDPLALRGSTPEQSIHRPTPLLLLGVVLGVLVAGWAPVAARRERGELEPARSSPLALVDLAVRKTWRARLTAAVLMADMGAVLALVPLVLDEALWIDLFLAGLGLTSIGVGVFVAVAARALRDPNSDYRARIPTFGGGPRLVRLSRTTTPTAPIDTPRSPRRHAWLHSLLARAAAALMSACGAESSACAPGEGAACEHRDDVAGARAAVRESPMDAGPDFARATAVRDDAGPAVEPAFQQTSEGFALATADPEMRFVVDGAAVYLVRGEDRILVLAPSRFARTGRDEAAATSEARTRGRRLDRGSGSTHDSPRAQ